MRLSYVLLTMLALALLLASCKDDPVTPNPDPDPEQESTIDTMTTSGGVQFVRTPDEQFQNLPDWSYPYQYLEIDGLRQAYAESGPVDGEVVLLLHGQPSWSYLYRKMIPVLADAGYRVIAMDHLGMGRSDKPVDIADYSYLGHCDRLEKFITGLGLSDINLFVQDWGSLIGLRVAGLNPDWFASISVGNGDLAVVPEGFQPFPPVDSPNVVVDIPYPFAGFPDQQVPFYEGCELIFEPGDDANGFGEWIEYALKGASFRASEVLESLTWFAMPDEIEAAYDAPFPSREYMAGVRVFPSLINELPGQNEEAWSGLTSFEKPFLTIWGSNDVGFQGSCETQQKFIDNVPGAKGKPHVRLSEAAHFLQEDQGEEIAERLVSFYRKEYEPEVGYEIMEIRGANEIITWMALDITQEEFDALELPQGWLKNEPREVMMDSAEFARSPSASMDGEFVIEEHFGHQWRHVATIVERGIEFDDQGLLVGNKVSKFHTVTFNAGRFLKLLTSPEGDKYVIITRDAGRTSDFPTIPDSWQLYDTLISDQWILQLPNPTLNIRVDNEDSFQGPLPN